MKRHIKGEKKGEKDASFITEQQNKKYMKNILTHPHPPFLFKKMKICSSFIEEWTNTENLYEGALNEAPFWRRKKVKKKLKWVFHPYQIHKLSTEQAISYISNQINMSTTTIKNQPVVLSHLEKSSKKLLNSTINKQYKQYQKTERLAAKTATQAEKPTSTEEEMAQAQAKAEAKEAKAQIKAEKAQAKAEKAQAKTETIA